MPFKYRFFFLLAFLAVFTKVWYFNDQHKLKGGFALPDNKLVLGRAGGEPAKRPSLRVGLTIACACRCFTWAKLRHRTKISQFQNCSWWQTWSLFCFTPSPLSATCVLKYHEPVQKSQAQSECLHIPRPMVTMRAQGVCQSSSLSTVSGHSRLCGQRAVFIRHSVVSQHCERPRSSLRPARRVHLTRCGQPAP